MYEYVQILYKVTNITFLVVIALKNFFLSQTKLAFYPTFCVKLTFMAAIKR